MNIELLLTITDGILLAKVIEISGRELVIKLFGNPNAANEGRSGSAASKPFSDSQKA